MIYFGILEQTSRLLRATAPTLSLIAVGGAVVAHLTEIGLYAAAYYVLTRVVPVGEVGVTPVTSPIDYFYYSNMMDASLGLGDAFPAAICAPSAASKR